MATAAELVEKLGVECKTFVSHGGGVLSYCRKIAGKKTPGKKLPVCLFLHGAGERGTGNNNGIQLIHGAEDILSFGEKGLGGLLFLAPQCPAEKMWIKAPWSLTEHHMEESPTKELALALELLEKEIEENDGDRERIYISGISMGGFGTWDALCRKRDYFASALICCGGGDVRQASILTDLPIYVFHGSADTTVLPCRSRDMVDAIRAAGGKLVRYREYEGVGHNCWTQTYADRAVLKEFFSHKR